MAEMLEDGDNTVEDGRGAFLDDRLLDAVNPNVTIVDGYEEKTKDSKDIVHKTICTKCRTISNSFLSIPMLHQRMGLVDLDSNATEFAADSSNTLSTHCDNYFDSDDAPLLNASPVIKDDEYGIVEDGVNAPGPNLSSYHCHSTKSHHLPQSKKAITKLVIACILTTVFMIGEVIGGWLANSVAIMSDAAHMCSDLSSFLVSLVAIYLAKQPATKRMSFGYHRAEVLGAVISVLIIWLITGILVYIAIQRVITMDFEVEADTMIIVSAIGVIFNIVLGIVLHSGSGSHGHSHHGMVAKDNHHNHNTATNINIRAAFIHVLGDLMQSIGVLVSAYIIRFYPSYKMADPVCTFVFSILVLFTTVPILRDLAYILMEGAPPGLDYNAICMHLRALPGVKTVHSLHVWALTLDKNACSVHIAIGADSNSETCLREAQQVLWLRHGIQHTTVQVELYQPHLMDDCVQCQPLNT